MSVRQPRAAPEWWDKMDLKPVVAVVILNWNKAPLTRRCLERARSATSLNPLWIVVDNGSTPPIENFPADVVLIRNDRNLGFAGGVNVGLRHAIDAGADYVWLLNNDAEPLSGTLDTLVYAAAADPSIGLASPVILNSDDNDAIDWHGSIWRDGIYDYTNDPDTYARWLQQTPNQICLTGTALLLTRRLIETIGAFDERLFAYWEDTDISLRAAAAGFRVRVFPEAAVRHACGTEALDAGNRAPYYYYLMTRNELLVLRKTGAPTRTVYWMLRRAVRWWSKPGLNSRQRRAILRGVVDGLLGRGGASPV
jgi:GT2 family glycosyltransferase